jgi:crossover junction endodeoxyribonuclease RusA
MSRLVLPYPPSLNNMFTTYRGRRVKSEEAGNYKATVGLIAVRAGWQPIIGDVTVTLTVYRPQKSGDLDNFLKAAFDSLKGIAWKDDKQVRRIVAERHEDPADPRIEITVEAYREMVF